MTEADLPLVGRWLREPHVAKWWTADTTAEIEVDGYRRCLAGEGDVATVALVVTENGAPIGWCQWYRWDGDPGEAEAMGARPGEVGIDYAIGEPGAVGRGLGTEMIAALVAEVRRHEPGAGVLVDPAAANAGSRRVLERNGFELVAVRPVASEPSPEPMAIYRLPGPPAGGSPGPSASALVRRRPVGPDSRRPDSGLHGGAPGRVRFVDAANVVGSRPTGWWRDRAGAASRLVDRLRGAVSGGRLEPPIVVILEGAARLGAPEGERDGVRVVHAAGSGDDRLVDGAAATPEAVLVVSADRGLGRRVMAVGGRVVGPEWLYRRL